jgi:hypothetical protein
VPRVESSNRLSGSARNRAVMEFSEGFASFSYLEPN